MTDSDPRPAALESTDRPGPVGPLVPGRTVGAWLLPALAILLWSGAVIRFAWRAAQNPSPAPLVRIPGFGDWIERAQYRRHCAFQGQFLVVDERLFTACPLGDSAWEMVRWDLAAGKMERRWPMTASKQDLQHVSGLSLAPGIAAALRLPSGHLAVVVHGLGAKAPLRLLLLGPEGGVRAHPLPGLSPGSLVGFFHRKNTFELVTADGRLHRLRPGGALQSAPLQGLPSEDGFAVELAAPLSDGWKIVVSGPSDEAKPPRYPLYLLTEPGTARKELGSMLDRVKGHSSGERLDLSPGNVLPVHIGQWPTHRLEGDRISPLPSPPPSLTEGLPRPSLLGTQVIRLDRMRMERLWQYSATALGPLPDPGSPSRVIQRWKWISRLEGGWIAGERVGTALRLDAEPRTRNASLTVARLNPVLHALPASGGGVWLFDSSGMILEIGPDLSWRNRPGLWTRLGRLWRREHLEPGALSFDGGRPIPPDAWVGFADRWALPWLLAGLPLLLPIGLLAARYRLARRGEGSSVGAVLRRPRGAVIWVCLLYLALAIPLLWRFWITTALY